MTPLALLVCLCQLAVIGLALWCQLTPRLRTGSIATLALGGLTLGALMGLARPTGGALALVIWLAAVVALVIIIARHRVPESMSHIPGLRWPPPDSHRRQAPGRRGVQ